ncbi:MAG: FHA domain-containing protein [Oscillospiraceae bacterium]|nr:FHA domain-containing protein [Oscillospiraceae bacterium]
MNYEIKNKTDFLTGSYLEVKVPEEEIDYNALYTIKADCPEFILPFHYKNTSGHVEFVHKVGTLCKLQYFSGDLSAKEYANLWQNLLEPLLVCGDWFMNPCSFVLKADYLYYDKDKKAVCYVYIPSVNGCCGYDAFYNMAVEVSKLMTVSDAVLENKVLRAIMKDFNPLEFLQMLKNHASECNDALNPPENAPDSAAATELPVTRDNQPEPVTIEKTDPDVFTGEIEFDFLPDLTASSQKKEKEQGGYKIFSSRSKKKKTAQKPAPQNGVQEHEAKQMKETGSKALPVAKIHEDAMDITQSTSLMQGGTGLRYTGNSQMPPVIRVNINEGEIFTVGRFDAAVGKKQSSFEFDKKTKAVSRRHAVIERSADAYSIIDLSSSAGTFVNDKKLPPNTPHGLETGFRVSFGNSGADYVWENS